MVNEKKRTNAILGLNKTDLILGAGAIVAGAFAFFTGGTSLAAYGAWAAGFATAAGVAAT